MTSYEDVSMVPFLCLYLIELYIDGSRSNKCFVERASNT